MALLLAYIFLSINHRRSNFLIEDEQREALQRISWRDGVPEAEQVHEALTEWL